VNQKDSGVTSTRWSGGKEEQSKPIINALKNIGKRLGGGH